MASVNSPNMTLPVPVVGSQPGPEYAIDINSCMALIDSHDHSEGRGVQINPAGININATLPFNDNQITELLSASFTAQGAAVDTLNALSVAPGGEGIMDLWYTDSAGNKVQITLGGEVNATIASLPGQSYAAGTFYWKQGSGSTTPANFDIGSIVLRPNVAATTNGVTVRPPSAIASAYDINLPLLPASQSLVTIDESGVMAAPAVYPLPPAALASSSITTAKIADSNVTTAKLADQAVTAAKIANATITSAQIDSILPAKVSGSIFTSSLVSVFTTTSTSNVLVARTSQSTASQGDGPYAIEFIGSNQGYVGGTASTNCDAIFEVWAISNNIPAALVSSMSVVTNGTSVIRVPASSLNCKTYLLGNVPGGYDSFGLYARRGSGSDSATASGFTMMVYQIPSVT